MTGFDHAFDLSRRRFLESIGIAGAAFGMATAAPWAARAAQSGRGRGGGDRVRFGVIGTGDRGSALLENLLQSRNGVVAAVCDDYAPNLARGLALTEGKAQTFTNHRAMLDARAVDAVVIATPLHMHASQTLDALDAGLPVFCEKSMARTLDDCTAMVVKARETRLPLQIGHQRLFKPTYLNAIAKIRAGEIGKVTQVRSSWHRHRDWRRPVPPGSGLERRINWRMYREYSAGLLTELASHQTQVADWAFDAVPRRIMGSGSICYWKDGREVPDHIALIYEYDGGRKHIYTSLLNNRRYGCEEQIQGDNGSIEAEVGKMFAEDSPPVPGLQRLIQDVSEGVFRTIPIGGASWASELPVTHIAPQPLGRGEYNETLLQLEHFAETVKTRRLEWTLLRYGYHASVAALLGEQAIETGQPVIWPEALVLPRTIT